MSLATVIILGTIVFWVGSDVYLLMKSGKQATISVTMYTTSKQYPIVPFLFGVLMGHFFGGF